MSSLLESPGSSPVRETRLSDAADAGAAENGKTADIDSADSDSNDKNKKKRRINPFLRITGWTDNTNVTVGSLKGIVLLQIVWISGGVLCFMFFHYVYYSKTHKYGYGHLAPE